MTKRLQRLHTTVVVAMSLAALVVAACVPAAPTRSDIIGTWVASPENGQHGSACPTLEFFDDGHFVASDLPPEYFAPASSMSAHGEWTLDESTNDRFSVHRLNLHFERNSALPSGFYMTLYIPVGGGSIYAGVDTHLFFDKGKACNN